MKEEHLLTIEKRRELFKSMQDRMRVKQQAEASKALEKAENFFEITTNILANSWESEEGKQGIKAFFEKKPAPWVKKGESNGQ